MAMSDIHIRVEGGNVIIKQVHASARGLGNSVGPARILLPTEKLYPTNDSLTASVVDTNNIKIVIGSGAVICDGVPFGKFKTGSNQAIGASANAVATALNGSSYFAAVTLESRITTSETNVTSLENVDTNDRGLFVDNSKSETSSKLSVSGTEATVQAGADTKVFARESGLGSIALSVAAGASNFEAEVTALTITGDTNSRTSSAFQGEVTLVSQSSTGGAGLSLFEASANGTNYLKLAAPTSIASSFTLTFPNTNGNSGEVLTTNGSGVLSWSADSVGIASLVADTTPQLGGSLDVNGQIITSAGNGDVVIDPSGSGAIFLKGKGLCQSLL